MSSSRCPGTNLLLRFPVWKFRGRALQEGSRWGPRLPGLGVLMGKMRTKRRRHASRKTDWKEMQEENAYHCASPKKLQMNKKIVLKSVIYVGARGGASGTYINVC